ncbi:MAG: outer membrane beta-barrel protein [Pseudomonadota bacterium]
MNRSQLISTAALFAVVSASPALSGDYNSGIVTKSPSEEYTDVEFGSGWYLRGDITFNLHGEHDTTSQFVTALGTTVQADYDDVAGVRVGVGYIVNPALRVEVTAGHMLESSFDGDNIVNLPGLVEIVDPVLGNVQTPTNNIYGIENVTASYDATNLMFNAYFDLPTYGRFTPYLGAGAGISRIEYNERRTLTCIPDTTQTCGPPAAGAQATRVENVEVLNTEETSYNFAYQLAVGTAYELSENLDLDIGYSYFSTNDGPEINYSDGRAIETDAFSVHRVNVGLRYEIW